MTRQLDSKPAAPDGSNGEPVGPERYAGSIAAFERATRSLAGGVSSNFRAGGQPVPLFFERGEGAHLIDIDGNDYVDYVLGMGPGILGHAPAAVVRAVREQADAGQLFAGQTLAEVELAERFTTTVACA